MRTATLSSLRTQARRYADMVNSTFVTDAEVNEYINQSYAELYNQLIQSGGDYALSSTTIAVTSGTDTYALPATFWRVRGVDVDLGSGVPYTMRKFVFEERHRSPAGYGWSAGYQVMYRLHGDNIKFTPSPTSSYTVTLWYHAAPGRMTVDADTIDGVAGWEEYVVLGAAIKCLDKEESSTEVLARRQGIKLQEILSLRERDAAHPERVTDVLSANDYFWGV